MSSSPPVPGSTPRSRALVLGASHWHVRLYAAPVAQVHDVVGFSDDDPDRVRHLAELWGGGPVQDWRELVATTDADVAYVFGPHDEVAQMCLALVARGVPVVVEKPLGTSLAQLQQVRREAERAGVPVTVPLIQRGGPVDTWLARAGQPVYQRHSFIAGPPERYITSGSPWMLDAARSGGGCLVNLGVHFTDLFLQGAGLRTAAVAASLSHTLHGGAVEDHATVVLTTEDGREAVIEVGYAFPSSPLQRYCSWSSAGADGFASIDTQGAATFTSTQGVTETAVLDVDSDSLYAPFVHRVADTLADGFAGLATLGELEDAMTIVWRAYDIHREAGPRA